MIQNQIKTRTGVILAAGFGSRLAGTVKETSLKPLTPVAGVPLIFRTIRSLEVAGCSKIVIVLGYAYNEIKSDIENAYDGATPIVFVKNENYKLSNGISVLTASSEIATDEFVLTMADHILSDEMMGLAATHQPTKDGATLLVDFKIDSIFDMDDATKVYEEGGLIKRIGKTIQGYNCIDTGVFICTKALIGEIEKVFKVKGDASLSDGVQSLSSINKMAILDIKDAFWQDVDTPEMLAYAEKQLAK
ncbi:nucleotidyltransferase [bacterium]|nr:MAG: nucleotidyltransferase [bacterium]